MNKVYTTIIIALLLGVGGTLSVYGATYLKPSITAKQIRADYVSKAKNRQVDILIVPGHEPAYGGTEYGSIKERDIVLMIADELETLLKKDKNISVFRTRNSNGWTSEFITHFEKEWANITTWVEDHKQKTIELLENGTITEVRGVEHNIAAPNVATRLYGINKWSNDNNIDIAIHLHINDVPRANTGDIGPYVGFAVYIPEKQYSNAKVSREIGSRIASRLKKVMKVSNYGQEEKGLIEDQELIAMGRYNTSEAASVLIEYGYIYESQFATEESQRAFAKKVANQTFLGLRDFLGKK